MTLSCETKFGDNVAQLSFNLVTTTGYGIVNTVDIVGTYSYGDPWHNLTDSSVLLEPRGSFIPYSRVIYYSCVLSGAE
jgi:hypothetical protein